MDRVRRVMLIAALVVDVGRRLPRRCGSVVPPEIGGIAEVCSTRERSSGFAASVAAQLCEIHERGIRLQPDADARDFAHYQQRYLDD